MSLGNTLAIARRLGYDNMVQIQNVRRGLKQNSGQTVAEFALPSRFVQDQFISKNPITSLDNNMLSVMERFFPKSFSDKAMSYIRLVLNKYSKNTGALSVDYVTKAGDDLLSSSKFKILRNNSVTKVAGEGYSTEADIYMKLNALFPNKHAKMPSQEAIVNGLDYSEVGGISKFAFDYKADRGLSSLSLKYDFPREMADAIAVAGSGGQEKSMAGLIETCKSFFRP